VAYNISQLTDYSLAALESAANECVRACQKEASAVRNDAELKAFRDRWIGRKSGILKQINDLWLKAAPKEAKRNVGHVVNEVKAAVENILQAAESNRLELATGTPLASERVDISLPGVRRPIGAEHPVIKTMHEVIEIEREVAAGDREREGKLAEIRDRLVHGMQGVQAAALQK